MEWIVIAIMIIQYTFYGIFALFSLAFIFSILFGDIIERNVEIAKYKNSLNQDEIYDFVENQSTCKK